MAEVCEFGCMVDDLIRDRLVVGILDSKLSVQLQMDPTLTLDAAVIAIRKAEHKSTFIPPLATISLTGD
jgi:hypothetical protein